MQPSSKRRLVGVVVLVWFLALGITARSFAAPSSGQIVLQVITPSNTPTESPTVTTTATASSTTTGTHTASPTATPTPPLLVISQFYGGGGESGATYLNDFVEIFNRGSVPVSLSGMSIQYASATGAGLFSGNVTTLSGTIPPGEYYLVQMASAGATGIVLPAPDANGTTNLATSGGKVILADDVAGLPCNAGSMGTPPATPTGSSTPSLTPTSTSTASTGCSASDLDKILDLVGYGTADFFEGGAAAPAHSNITAGFRASNGCTDSDDNSADFITGAPVPRNSITSPNYCVLTATPTDTATDTATVTDTATITDTATSTDTPTITNSPTVTNTGTITPTRTPSPTAFPTRAVVINEVGWAGTRASADDEWIELYNTTGFPIDLTGWKLVAADGSPSIDLSGEIPGLGFFLLERCDDDTVSDIGADITYDCSATLANAGEILRLFDPNGVLTGRTVDTANADGGGWPAGLASPNYNSMERRTGMPDSATAWITNTGVFKNGLDAGIPSGCTANVNCTTNPQAIYGTPKQVNWANFVTPTPSPTPSRTPTPTRTFAFSTAPPSTSHDFVVLNEFLPQPSTDWNFDGVSDTDDEYIEIMNIGTAPVNLFGWKLDDADPSTPAYAIPGQLLTQGQRLAYFASDTGLGLSDSGGSVRLYRQTVVVDSFTYPVVTKPDIAWCRLPDGTGAWVFGCVPTADEPNEAGEGVVPGATPPPTVPTSGEAPPPVSSLCLMQAEDYLPAVYAAECYIPGLGVWDPDYWDATSRIFGPLAYYPRHSKWAAYFE